MISCSLEDHGKPRRRTVAVGPRGEAPGQPGRGTPKPGRMCPEPGVNGAPLEATLETAGVTASVVAAASMGGDGLRMLLFLLRGWVYINGRRCALLANCLLHVFFSEKRNKSLVWGLAALRASDHDPIFVDFQRCKETNNIFLLMNKQIS